MNSFERYKEQLNTQIDNLQGLITESSFNDRLNDIRIRVNREKMNMLVVGEFSRGKSMFINAILGQAVLPSKVQPTTATINVLEHGASNVMEIHYHNKVVEKVNLPEDKVNKFLESYVSASNESANMIERVEIKWHKGLKEWDCVLVDTPGVNDLDETRERITYDYLSKADACIVLLDCQQPLSESERAFISDKVLSKDINRFIFVLNKYDEISDHPEDPSSQRLKNYVAKLLLEKLNLQSDHIYTVSAKETLKSRVHVINSLWEKDFENFEKSAIDFLAKNAIENKMQSFKNSIQHLVESYLIFLETEYNLIKNGISALKEKESELQFEEKEALMSIKLKEQYFEKEKLSLENEILIHLRTQINALKAKCLSLLENCQNDFDLIQLKSTVNKGIKELIEDIMIKIKRKQTSIVGHICENTVLSETESWLMLKLEEQSFSALEKEKDTLGIIASGSLALVVTSILGPIGILAGIFSANYIKEGLFNDSFLSRRRKMRESIEESINHMILNVEKNTKHIVEDELNKLSNLYNEELLLEIEQKKRSYQAAKNNIEKDQNDIQIQLSHIDDLRQRLLSQLKE